MARDRAGAFVLRDQTVLLVHRHKQGREYWAVPGGGIEPDETDTEAARRELFEETGLTITLKRLCCRVRKANGTTEFYYLAHVASGTLGTGTGPEFNPTEASRRGSYEFVFVPFEQVARLPLLPSVLKEYLVRALQEGWPTDVVVLIEDV